MDIFIEHSYNLGMTTTPPIRVRSAAAMRITRMDRQKFNEIMSAGFFRCAPTEMLGNTRLFREHHLVALFILARLLEFGFPPRRAGALACDIYEAFRPDKDEKRIVLAVGTMLSHIFAGSEYDPDHVEKDRCYAGLGDILFTVSFEITTIRKIIASGIEYERSIVGREED